MRRNLLIAVLVGTSLSLGMWGVSSAQNQAARSGAPAGVEARVALVDVAYVFKKYEKFNRLYNEMKEEVKKREEEINKKQTELKALLTKKQSFTADSTNARQIDQQIVQLKTELELLADSSRREFTQKEANLYHQTYQEVEKAIKSYAEYNGITLVLRASRDDDNTTNNPQDVIKEVSQQVVYSLPQMDVTDDILKMLNGNTSKQPLSGGEKPVTPTKGAVQPPKTTNQNDSKKPASGGTIKK